MTELLTTQNEREILSLDLIWNPLKIGIDAGAGTLGVSVLDHFKANLSFSNTLVSS